MVLEFNHVHAIMVEHAFTSTDHAGIRGNLDLLMEIATAMPQLMFADFWHGYFGICAPRSSSRGSGLSHDHLHTARLGKVHTRADASIVRRPARGFRGSAYERETGITIARSALLPVDIPLRGSVVALASDRR